VLAVALAPGCGATASMESGSEETSSTDTGTDTTASETGLLEVGWFELGWGAESFAPLPDGSDLTIVYGCQGAAMFPLPVHGGEFTLPADPTDYSDPDAPLLDIDLDIEGHNDGVGGRFKHIANYPIGFDILPDGTYEFVYVAVIVPDGKDPLELVGLPAHLWARMRPSDSAPLELELDLVVALDESGCPG